MTNELQNVNQTQDLAQWMNPKTLVARLNRLKEVYRTVMKPDVHYGKIPGCSQDSLWQPGSQVLCLCFGLGHEPTNVEEFKDDDEIRYRVTDRVFDQKTGITIGYGIGECSSSEEKYKWKKAVSQKEFDATDDDRKRIKYGKDYEVNQVRTNPADVANTILKMARKRANVNGTIEALAASEVFTQDLEDLPEGMDLGRDNAKGSTKPVVSPDDVKARPQGGAAPEVMLRGVLKSVSSKPTKTGGTKYDITIGTKTFGAFDSKLGTQAEALRGKEVEYTTSINGKYENLESVRLYIKPAAAPVAPAQTTKPSPAASTPPAVEDSDSFATTITLIASSKGIEGKKAIDEILEAEFAVSLDSVPADMQAQIMAHFGEM
jgi:hypothetical protein